nr:neprilysin-1-like [Dermacentor andersoni]
MSTLTTERRTTTTSTNATTSTRPRPRSWLDIIEESPNRRKIEVGLISSICLVLLIVLSLTLFVVLTLQTNPVNKAPVNLQNAVFCENATCFEQARRVMGYVEWSREPCDDFYTYACKGYHVSVANSASKYPITQGAQEQLRAAVEEVLANWHANMKPMDNFYLRYGVNLFQECMQGVTDAKEQLQSVFADMTYNHKPFFLPKSFDLEPHTLASRVGRNFWFFPLITVRKDVDLENRQRMIVHLDEPELTAPRALFDDADFQREYLQAIRDLAINLGFDNVNETGRIFKLEQMLSKGTTSSRARAPYYKKVKLGSLFLDKWNIYMYLSNVLGENMSPEDEVALRSEKYFSRFLKSLKTTEWGTVNNFIVFRLVQFLSPLLMPKESKILQFMYKYGHALRPPPSKRTRCLDIMEPYFKPLLLTAAKVTFKDTETKRAEASRAIANLKESFKRMSIKSFYPHTEQSTLNNKLRRMRIYYFYPYETKEYQYMKQWYRSWKKLQYKYGQIVKSFRNAGFEFAKSQAHKTIQDFEWKGSVFQQDPFYDADNNALYIPASLFEPPLYYGDSFLPFSIPMYGWRIGVKMFQAIDYRGRTITDSAQYRNWWGETLMARYNEVEKCFRNAHGSLKLADESELYDHIADSAVVIVLFREYKRVVQSRVGPDKDIRLRDIKQFSGDNLFFLSLAHGVCTRIFSDAAQVQKKGGKRIAQERLNMALTHWPMFKSLYECPSSAHMVPQRRCMFW